MPINPLLGMALIQGGSSLFGSMFKDPEFNVPPEYRIAINDLLSRSRRGMSPEAMEGYLEEGGAGISNLLTSGKEQLFRTIGRQGGDSSLAPTFIKNLYGEGARQRRGLSLDLAKMNEQIKSESFNQLSSLLGGKTYGDISKFYADKSMMPDFGSAAGLGELYFMMKMLNPQNKGGGSSSSFGGLFG